MLLLYKNKIYILILPKKDLLLLYLLKFKLIFCLLFKTFEHWLTLVVTILFCQVCNYFTMRKVIDDTHTNKHYTQLEINTIFKLSFSCYIWNAGDFKFSANETYFCKAILNGCVLWKNNYISRINMTSPIFTLLSNSF